MTGGDAISGYSVDLREPPHRAHGGCEGSAGRMRDPDLASPGVIRHPVRCQKSADGVRGLDRRTEWRWSCLPGPGVRTARPSRAVVGPKEPRCPRRSGCLAVVEAQHAAEALATADYALDLLRLASGQHEVVAEPLMRVLEVIVERELFGC